MRACNNAPMVDPMSFSDTAAGYFNIAPGDRREVIEIVNDVIDRLTPEGPYHSRELAEDVYKELVNSDPDILVQWLCAQAEHFLNTTITVRDRSRRGRFSSAAGGRRFQAAVTAYENGDPNALRPHLDGMRFVVETGARKKLGQLNGKDCQYVADGYGRLAERNKMREAFFASLIRRIGNDTIEDHYTEEQIAAMWPK